MSSETASISAGTESAVVPFDAMGKRGPILSVCIGNMFAGKTQWLLDRFNENSSLGGSGSNVIRTAIAFKPRIDSRYSKSMIVSHRGAAIPAYTCASLGECIDEAVLGLGDKIGHVRAACIDEGQFFVDLVDGCLRLLDMGISVYVSALNATAQQKPWPAISDLLAHADSIKHIQAGRCSVCGYWCAPHTRVRPDLHDKEGRGVVVRVGGNDVYEAVCRDCLYRT